MLRQLPSPIKEVRKPGVKFSVYLAKDFFQETWASKELLKVLKEARRSYLRYGKVALLDKYDTKSLVYLIRAEYKIKIGKQNLPVEEWLSVRFIPGDGTPNLTEDFSHSIANGKALKHLFQKKLFPNKKNFFGHVVTLSRICKIPPKISDIHTKLKLDLPKKNKYTFYSFCLANETFLEHEYSKNNFLYLTALFRDEALKKSLLLNSETPFLNTGHKILGLNRANLIKIKRYPFIFNYPNYFLNTGDIFSLLKKLIAQGKITTETLAYYTKNKTVRSRDLDLSVLNSPNLGKLFNERGKLKFSSITGSNFRKMVNDQVKDGPKLKIISINNWNKVIKKTLKIF